MRVTEGIRIRDSDMAKDIEDVVLRRRFEQHLDVYRLHEVDHARREEQILKEQENTARNISELTNAIIMQSEATKPIIRFWDAWDIMRKMIVWLSGFSGLGVFIAWAFDLIKIGGVP